MSLFRFVDLQDVEKKPEIQEDIATEIDIDNFFKKLHFDIQVLNKYKRIYVLVSGGYDSTLLADYVSRHYPGKTWFLNSYNPFEVNKTLVHFTKLPNFVQVKPDKRFNYGDILKDAFLNLPAAFVRRCKGKYSKNVFGCCYYIKHKSYKGVPLFKEEGTCVVSGIKDGDGFQRHEWMNTLRGSLGGVFEHKHKSGQVYVYPYRDYKNRELPKDIRAYLKRKYPNISHSGCRVCPVLVLFGIEEEGKRYQDSVDYAKKLGIDVSMYQRYIPSETKKRFMDIQESRQHLLFDFLDKVSNDETYEEGDEMDDLELGVPIIDDARCKSEEKNVKPCNDCWVILQYPCGKVCKTCSVENPSSTQSMFISRKGRSARHLQDPIELMGPTEGESKDEGKS